MGAEGAQTPPPPLASPAIQPRIHTKTSRSAYTSTDKLYSLGASRVVFSLSVAGHLLASSAVSPIIAEFMDRIILTQEVEIGHLHIDSKSPITGRTLADLGVRKRTGCTVIGIMDEKEGFHPNPGPDARIEDGQTLICLGPSQDLLRLFETVQPEYRDKQRRQSV